MFNSIANRTTPVVKNLIIINALAFFAQISISNTPWGRVEDVFALHSHLSPLFRPFQIVTHMFMHGGIFHLFFNMFGLWMFGSLLEKIWGAKRFILFYFVCGITAAFFQLVTYWFFFKDVNFANIYDPQTIEAIHSSAIGASGAVVGIAAAFAYLFPNTELIIFPIPVPIKAKWAILGYVVFETVSGFANMSGDNVAHFAHVGGAVAGFLLTLAWKKPQRNGFL